MTQLTGKLETNLFNSAKLSEKTAMLQISQWQMGDDFSKGAGESFSKTMSSRMHDHQRQETQRQNERRDSRDIVARDVTERNVAERNVAERNVAERNDAARSDNTRPERDRPEKTEPRNNHSDDHSEASQQDKNKDLLRQSHNTKANDSVEQSNTDSEASEEVAASSDLLSKDGLEVDESGHLILNTVEGDGVETNRSLGAGSGEGKSALLGAASNLSAELTGNTLSSLNQDSTLHNKMAGGLLAAGKSSADASPLTDLMSSKTTLQDSSFRQGPNAALEDDLNTLLVKNGASTLMDDSQDAAALKELLANKGLLKSNASGVHDMLKPAEVTENTKMGMKTLSLENALVNAGIMLGQKNVKPEADAFQLEKTLAKSVNPKTGVSSVIPNELSSSLRTQGAESSAQKLTIPITVRVGQPQWAGQLAERTAWLASQKLSSADIQLDPPELGPISVKVHVQQDQASVSFVSHNPNVREALDQSVARLRDMFQQEGMDLVDVNVSDQSKDQENGEDGDSGGARGTQMDSDHDNIDQENNGVAVQTLAVEAGIDHFV